MIDKDNQIRLIKQEIQENVKHQTRGAIVRSRTNWELMGEKPTKYFLNLEKNKAVAKTIQRLKNDSGHLPTDSKVILDEIKNYYRKLYTSKGPIQTHYTDRINIPKLPQEISLELDQDITLSELSEALKSMKNNVSPGIDGLPADFYKVFWGKLKFLIYDVIGETVKNASYI